MKQRVEFPTIHVVSDSVGATAQSVARAATSQFGVTNPNIEVLPKATSFKDIKEYLDQHCVLHKEMYIDPRLLVFYTLVDLDMRRQFEEYLEQTDQIIAVDLISSAIDSIAQFSGQEPSATPGSMHVADQNYFNRIAALEFTIDHDDGRSPQDLTKADIVLIGVSRTSKTPLSVYLAQQGYRVANVPLDLHTEPPAELYNVDPTRLFGLMTTAEVLTSIRKRRLGAAGHVAASYADPEYVYQDLEKARALMRKLGCIVVHTENRAVEETAQEILRYHELAHPHLPDTMGKSL